MVDRLTVNGERDFGLHGGSAERIAGLAAEAGVIVAGLGAEYVDVARLAARRLVGMVNLLFVLEPDDLSQRIAAARDALQFRLLAHPNSFAFRVADNLRLSGWIYYSGTEKKMRGKCWVFSLFLWGHTVVNGMGKRAAGPVEKRESNLHRMLRATVARLGAIRAGWRASHV